MKSFILAAFIAASPAPEAPIEVLVVPTGQSALCVTADGCFMLTQPGLGELAARIERDAKREAAKACGKSL